MIGQECPFIPNGHELIDVLDSCSSNIVSDTLFSFLFFVCSIYYLRPSFISYGSGPGSHSRRFSPFTPTSVTVCTYVPCVVFARMLHSHLFPRRLASNCAYTHARRRSQQFFFLSCVRVWKSHGCGAHCRISTIVGSVRG